MARYLSAEWFASAVGASGAPLDGPVEMVLEQVVRATPDGEVVYRVEVAGDRARIVWPVPAGATPAHLRITTDWSTAVAVARGDLSAQRALMEGRLRIKGSPPGLAAPPRLDAVPASVRASTTFD
jgi:hypothetical protein